MSKEKNTKIIDCKNNLTDEEKLSIQRALSKSCMISISTNLHNHKVTEMKLNKINNKK